MAVILFEPFGVLVPSGDTEVVKQAEVGPMPDN